MTGRTERRVREIRRRTRQYRKRHERRMLSTLSVFSLLLFAEIGILLRKVQSGGVPTVADAATLALDLLDEAGADLPDPAALRGQGSVMVTPRDIDARAGQLARVVGFGVGLALQPSLSLDELRALID